jgi:glycosyltransferase involved in cell wall biosynthesis
MKVLHVVKTAVGASWVYHQVRVLRSLGIQIVVALPSDTDGLAPRYRQAGAEVVRAEFDFPADAPWRFPAPVQTCRDLVRQIRPDLIHTHHVGTTLTVRLALGKKSPIPRVFQVAGPLHLEHSLFANLDIYTAGPQDRWVATCEWTRRKYHQLGIPSNRVFLSYSGTDTRLFRETRTGHLRRELDISKETPLVGLVCYIYAPKWYLGQSRGLKGHEDFFAALRGVRELRPEIRGVVIGGAWGRAAWYEKRLRKLGARICGGSLTFLGTRTDVPALYADLDLAVVPSHSENVGGAVESLLSGVPVVATNVGGLPDLIQENRTGFVVPPRNPKALATAISAALDDRDEARRRTMNGQTLARSLFDVERTGREVAGIYRDVLQDSGHIN